MDDARRLARTAPLLATFQRRALRWCSVQVNISEMLLGPAPTGFVFQPKHKAQSTLQSEQEMALAAGDGQDNG